MADIALTTPAANVEVPQRKRRSIIRFRFIVYVILTFAALVYILPFAYMLGKSLQNSFEANSTTRIIPSQFEFQNYSDVLFGSRQIGITRQFIIYLKNTILLEALSVGGQTVICVLAAYAFARMTFPGRDLLFGMLLLTLFVPAIILLVPNLIIVTRVSQFFENIHPSLKWMNNWPALVIPFMANTFSIFLLRQFFKQIPDELWDAARIDGAGHWRFLWGVVVPISWSAIMTTVLFSFIGVWSALEWPILVTSDDSWRPISVALWQFRGDGGTVLQLLMAAAVIALLPIMILYLFTQRFFTQGFLTSGLGGR
jgi:ABC-type glycerol-3-phosphate transport system permease component